MRALLFCLVLAARAAFAQPVLDIRAVPGLSDAGRAGYSDFLLANLPRAFAIGSGGAFGWSGGTGTLETAKQKALDTCNAHGAGCSMYAENLDVVWQGRAALPNATPPAFVSTWNYAIVPDPRFLWHGAAQAAGVFVWAHGLGSMNGHGALNDARGSQPQSYVRAFNNAGFDVVRFERDPNADARDRAASWLEDSLADLRRRGYRRIIAGGQSRGAWNSLQMLTHPGLADAVVAVSPAAHGQGGSPNLTAQYDDLRQLVSDVPAARTRLAFVQFAADPFAGDLARRRTLIERLQPRLGGLLIIDQPDGLSGHGGGNSAKFATRFGPCLLHFVIDATPPASCP